MNFLEVRAQLTDLPGTFLRPDNQFQNLLDSLAYTFVQDTSAGDAMALMVQNITNAIGGWVDVWGLLFDIPRMANEADLVYLARIIYTVNAGGGTPVGIASWIQAVWNTNVIVTENVGGVGYTLTFTEALTIAQIQAIVNSLIRIRPAGVPITAVYRQSGSTVLDTVTYLDSKRVIGGYLSSGLTAETVTLSSTTNNALPLLPSFLLTDPVLNPGL